MNYLRLALPALFLCATLAPMRAATNEEVDARRVAEDLAGAFSNDGFKKRDGCWLGHLEPKKARVLQVNLYAGNQYWFSVGTTPGAKTLSVSVHDEAGKPLPAEPYAAEGKAAAGFAPKTSGPYYLRLEETEGKPVSFCLVYSYK